MERADDRGQMVTVTVKSIKARVRSFAPTPLGIDITVEVRAMRCTDGELSDAAAARRSTPESSQFHSEAAGAALIAALSL